MFSSFYFRHMPAFLVSFCDEWNSGPLLCNACPTGFVPGLKHRRNGFNGKQRENQGHQATCLVTRRTTQTFVESPSSSLVIEIQVRVEVFDICVDCVDWFGKDWQIDGVMSCCLKSGWGEGEHKIMNVIRNHPEHTHCLCSNDAAPWMAKKVRFVTVFSICQCPLSHGEVLEASAVFQRLSFVWMWGFGIFGSGLQIRTRVSLAHQAQLWEEASPRFGGTGAKKVQLTNINPNWGFPMSLDPDLGYGWKLICFDCNLQNSTFICN